MAKFSFRRESDAPRARRFTELFLLVLAVGISSFGMYLIDPEHAFDTSKSQWLPCTVVLGAGALLIHLVMQFRARYADPFILPLVVALNGIGLTMIYRLDPQIAAPVVTVADGPACRWCCARLSCSCSGITACCVRSRTPPWCCR